MDKYKFTSQEIDNIVFDETVGARGVIPVGANGVAVNPATEETLQKSADKIPTYDLYITYNGDGTFNQKIWKEEGTENIVKTLTYNYSGGNLISKILS